MRDAWSRWRAWWREPHFLRKASVIGVAVVLLQLVLLPPAEPLRMLCSLAGLAVLVMLWFTPKAACWCGLALCLATSYVTGAAFGVNYAVVAIMFLAVGYVMPPAVAVAVPIVYTLVDVAGFALFGSGSAGGDAVKGMLDSLQGINPDGTVARQAGPPLPAHSPLVLVGAVTFELMVFAFLTIIGAAFRRTSQTADRLARTERMLGRVTREQTLAHMIHDSVANDMSVIAMLAWRAKNMDDDAETLDRIYERAHHALDRVHEVIDILNGKRELEAASDVGDGGVMPGGVGSAAGDPQASFDARLEKVVEDQDRTMAMLGIRGQSRLNCAPDADVPVPVRRATLNLIEEIYANIVRHGAIGGVGGVGTGAGGGRSYAGHAVSADADGPLRGGSPSDDALRDEPSYHLFIDIQPHRILLREVNDLADESATMVHGHRHGSGVELQRAAIEALGGTVNASAQDGAWMIAVEIPW